MSQLSTFRPVDTYTASEVLKREQESNQRKPDLLDASLSVASNEWLHNWFMRRVEQSQFQLNPDPNFKLDRPTFDTLKEGLDPEYWGGFTEAVSMNHGMLIRDQLKAVQDSRKDVARAGTLGTAANLIVGGADPAIAIPTLLTGGAASAVSKAGVIGRLVEGGFVAAAQQLPFEVFRKNEDPTYTFSGLLSTELGAFAFGVGGSAIEQASPAVSNLFRRVRPGEAPEFVPPAPRVATEAPAQPATPNVAAATPEIAAPATAPPREPVYRNFALDAAHQDADLPYVPQAAFDTALSRLKDIDPSRKLNREEVDGILEGTGYKTQNQGWPTAEDMRGYIENMAAKERASVADPVQVAMHNLSRDAEFETATGVMPASTGESHGETPIAMGAASRSDPAFRPGNPTAEVGDVVLTNQGKVRYQEQTSPDGAAKAVENWIAAHELDAITATPDEQAMAARARANPKQFLREGQRAYERMTMQTPLSPESAKIEAVIADLGAVSDAKGEAGMIGMVPQIAHSDVPAARAVARMLAEDPLSVSDAASTFIRRTHMDIAGRANTVAEQQFKEWAIDNGIGFFGRFKGSVRDRFEHEVAVHMTDPGAMGYAPHPAVIKAAAAYRAALNEAAGIAGRMKTKGFDGLQKLDNYLPRVYKASEFVKGIALWGEKDFTAAWDQAIQQGLAKLGKDVDPAATAKVAKGIVGIQKDRTLYSDAEKVAMFAGDRSDDLVAAMREHGVSEHDIKSVLFDIATDPEGKLPPRTRHRVPLDEGFRMEMPDGSDFAVQNFVDRNAGRLVNNYVRGTLGLAGESAVLQEASRRFGAEVTSWDQLKNLIEADGNRIGQAKQLESIMPKLDTLHKLVLGIPVTKPGVYKEVARGLRATNHALLMGGAAYNQFSELGRTVGDVGFAKVLNQIPALRSIFKMSAEGKMSDQFRAELQGLTGFGGESVARRVFGKLDPEMLGLAEERATGFTGAAETLAQASSSISAFNFFDKATKDVTVHAVAQHLIDTALSGKAPKGKRLEAFGMSPEEWARVAEQIRAHKETIVEPTGQYKTLGIDQWTDQTAAARFVLALQRHGERLIQVNDPGNYAQWMTTETGKLISQFRNFPIIAYEKQFRAGIHQASGPGGDPLRTLSTFAMASVSAAVVYALRIYANSIGRPDASEYRAEMLSPSALARAAISRSGWTSMAPQLYDTAAQWTGMPSQFEGQRSTYQNNDLILGNPSYSLLTQSLPRATRAVVRQGTSALGIGEKQGPLTQSEAKAIGRIVPFQNITGLKNALDAWAESRPTE